MCHMYGEARFILKNVYKMTYMGLSLQAWGEKGVMVKAMDCGIVVSEFVLQSHYYVYFGTNTLGKGMSPLILPAMG